MIDSRTVAGVLAHEYQCFGSDESSRVFASLGRALAGLIEDEGERARFVDVASMSGLEIDLSTAPIEDGPADLEGGPHVGHHSAFGGLWYCDTCDSPYCDLA